MGMSKIAEEREVKDLPKSTNAVRTLVPFASPFTGKVYPAGSVIPSGELVSTEPSYLSGAGFTRIIFNTEVQVNLSSAEIIEGPSWEFESALTAVIAPDFAAGDSELEATLSIPGYEWDANDECFYPGGDSNATTGLIIYAYYTDGELGDVYTNVFPITGTLEITFEFEALGRGSNNLILNFDFETITGVGTVDRISKALSVIIGQYGCSKAVTVNKNIMMFDGCFGLTMNIPATATMLRLLNLNLAVPVVPDVDSTISVGTAAEKTRFMQAVTLGPGGDTYPANGNGEGLPLTCIEFFEVAEFANMVCAFTKGQGLNAGVFTVFADYIYI